MLKKRKEVFFVPLPSPRKGPGGPDRGEAHGGGAEAKGLDPNSGNLGPEATQVLMTLFAGASVDARFAYNQERG